MNRLYWIFFILLIILFFLKLWDNEGKNSFSWTKCKESLLVHLVTGKCTLIKKYIGNTNQIYH